MYSQAFVSVVFGSVLGFFISIFYPNQFTGFLGRHRVCGSKIVVTHGMNAERAEKLNDKKLLFIGVLTSAKYLDTKAKAVNQTWASDIQGNLEFFVGSNISFQNGNNQMPVRALRGVKDIEYPPQRKIMAMLKYMYDNYIDEYQWFMRADDDVYVRTEKLQQFLQSLDSSEDTVVGQGGTGKRQEKNKLGLIKHECYCLGGPGVFMSRGVLKKIVPNLEECLKETASGHEDVELGRCIRKYAGVSCLWAEQVSTNPCLW
jgi:chondroitin sulfate synthase